MFSGHLSLVGPRPLPPEYLDRYNAEQRRRHDVRPGLTGAAQIKGRNLLPWPDRLAADSAYAEHVSLSGDLAILGTTARMMLRRGNPEASTTVSAPFLGNPDSEAQDDG